MTIVTVGIDLAKNVFAVHGVNEHGKADLIKPTVARKDLHDMIANLPPCTIGMEACSGAHYWAKLFQESGHTVKLMAPKFVSPYRMGGRKGKNDAADAAAICEAVTRPTMRFVPIKSIEQQGELFVHRTRQGYIEQRTSIINRMRGLLSEVGITIPLSPESVKRHACLHLDKLSHYCNHVIADLIGELERLDEKVNEYDRLIEKMARQNIFAQSLMKAHGIGPITASAIAATVGNVHDFKNGRQFAAWLGLTPGQYSSGGKARLGRITKNGDSYIRTLLVMGARSILSLAKKRNDALSQWALALRERKGYWKTVIAIAAKNARLCFAILKKGEDFDFQLHEKRNTTMQQSIANNRQNTAQ